MVNLWMNIEIRNSYYIISFDIGCPNVIDVTTTSRYHSRPAVPPLEAEPGEDAYVPTEEEKKEIIRRQKRWEKRFDKEEGISFEEKFIGKKVEKGSGKDNDAILSPNTKFKIHENILRFKVKTIHKLLYESHVKKMLGDKINHLALHCKIGKNLADVILAYYPKLEGHI